jgi:hypothetical protein
MEKKVGSDYWGTIYSWIIGVVAGQIMASFTDYVVSQTFQ